MNKVKWMELGGAPIRNDDWNFESNAVRDALKGIVKMLKGDALLGGCVPSPAVPPATGYTFTEGYVAIDGEVYYVPAVTVPITFDEDNNFFKIEETSVVPDGDIVMEDSSSANIYKRRIATLNWDDPMNWGPGTRAWEVCYNNRFDALALNAVVGSTLYFEKGLFIKRYASALSVSSNSISFDNRLYNAITITTNNDELQTINLSIRGSAQYFFAKVSGTGYLKVKHGTIACNGQRDHYFKPGDVLLFFVDGTLPTSNVCLVTNGDEDVWHKVTSYEAGCTGSVSLGELRYKKQGNMLVLDGVVEIDKMTFTGDVCVLPANYRPVIGGLFLVFTLDTTNTPPTYFTTGSMIGSTGLLRVSITDYPIGEKYSFSGISIALD